MTDPIERLTESGPVVLLSGPTTKAIIAPTKPVKPAGAPGRSRALDTLTVEMLRRRPVTDPDYDDLRADALAAALAIWAGEETYEERLWDPNKHKRYPKGHPLAGKFRPMLDIITEGLQKWEEGGKKGDPFQGFNRDQLLKVAKARGLKFKPGADRDAIGKALLEDIEASKAKPKTPAPGDATPETGAIKMVVKGQPVTLTPWGTSKPGQASLSVEVGGQHLGAIHENKDGTWQAAGKKVSPPKHVATSDDAILTLIDAQTTPKGKSKTAKLDPASAPPPASATGDPLVDFLLANAPENKPDPLKPVHIDDVQLKTGVDSGHLLVEANGVKLGNITKVPYQGWIAYSPDGTKLSDGSPTNYAPIQQLVAHHNGKAAIAAAAKAKAAPAAAPAGGAGSGVPGVTLTKSGAPGFLAGYPQMFKATYLGNEIGDIHGDPAGNNWIPVLPFDAKWKMTAPGVKGSKDEALKVLVDSWASGAPKAPVKTLSTVPGVNLEKLDPAPFPDYPNAYEVFQGGVSVGTVHGHKDGNGWLPFKPSNAKWTVIDPGEKKTQTAAIEELIKSAGAPPVPSGKAEQMAAGGHKVTTTPFPGGKYGDYEESFMLEIDGDHKGAVHKEKDGGWIGIASGLAKTYQTPLPKPATKSEAIKNVVDAHDALANDPQTAMDKIAALEKQAAKDAAKAVKDATKPVKIAPVKAPPAMRRGDFSALKLVEGGKGTTPGGIFEAPDGSRWYVKGQRSPLHAANEALAADFYRAAGIDAPEVLQGAGTPGLPGESHTATRMVDGAVTDLEMVAKDKTNGITGPYLAKLRQGFALDAWLANWDVAGEGNENPWANIVRGTDGNPHRIDVGGALLFRGMGGPKGDTFGEKVVEWETMRDLSRGRRHAQLFDDMSPAELLASANRVKAITPAQIRKMVQARGMDSELADLLIARRKDLLSRLAVKVKPSPKWKTATTGREALQAAPAKVGGPGGVKALTGLGMPNDRAYLSASAFEDYKGEDYGPINRALLKAGGKPLDPDLTPSVRNQIDRIRDGFKFSKLKEDVIVYRGERAPARSFPDGTWSLAGGMEGMEWTGHNFGSSSASKRTAVSFALGHTSAPKHQAQATIFRILVPKGTPAVELGGGSNDGEEELLLGEGLTYRVVKDHGVAYEPDSDINIRQIDIEVVKK